MDNIDFFNSLTNVDFSYLFIILIALCRFEYDEIYQKLCNMLLYTVEYEIHQLWNSILITRIFQYKIHLNKIFFFSLVEGKKVDKKARIGDLIE